MGIKEILYKTVCGSITISPRPWERCTVQRDINGLHHLPLFEGLASLRLNSNLVSSLTSKAPSKPMLSIFFQLLFIILNISTCTTYLLLFFICSHKPLSRVNWDPYEQSNNRAVSKYLPDGKQKYCQFFFWVHDNRQKQKKGQNDQGTWYEWD